LIPTPPPADISDEIKFAWKIQRDMAERGHSLASIQASIEARKPDFDAYIDPQKKKADVIIEVLPTQLVPDEKEGKILRVRLIQKEGKYVLSFFSAWMSSLSMMVVMVVMVVMVMVAARFFFGEQGIASLRFPPRRAVGHRPIRQRMVIELAALRSLHSHSHSHSHSHPSPTPSPTRPPTAGSSSTRPTCSTREAPSRGCRAVAS